MAAQMCESCEYNPAMGESFLCGECIDRMALPPEDLKDNVPFPITPICAAQAVEIVYELLMQKQGDILFGPVAMERARTVVMALTSMWIKP